MYIYINICECVCVCGGHSVIDHMCVYVSMAPLREVSVVASHSTACRLWFSCGPPPGPTFGAQRKYTRGACSHSFLDPSFIGLRTLVYFGCIFMYLRMCNAAPLCCISRLQLTVVREPVQRTGKAGGMGREESKAGN